MPISGELIAGALAGLAFVGCSLGNAGPAPSPGRRREVVVNGKRVKTVDIHAHCIVPEAAAVISHPLEAPGLLWSNLADRIAEMDAEGIDVEALSINPYWYRAERDPAAELIKIQNEKLAEFCAATPDRFVAFATVAAPAARSRAARLRDQDIGSARPVGRRQRRRAGIGRPQIPPGLGQGRGAWHPDLHAPARHQGVGAERPA